MIDTLVFDALTAVNLKSLLQAADSSWRVWPAGALGSDPSIPAVPEYPFVQYNENGSNRARTTMDSRLTSVAYYDVYVYDKPGSFLRIKTLQNLIIDNLEGIVGLVTAGGWRVTEFTYTNSSGDNFDPVTQRNSKRATFRSVASRAVS